MFIKEIPLFLKDIRACCKKYSYTWFRGVHHKSSAKIVTQRSINDDTNSDAEESALLHDSGITSWE